MAGIGAGEALIILLVAFVIVGPEDLPKAARRIGRIIRTVRSSLGELKDDLKIDIDEIGEHTSELQSR